MSEGSRFGRSDEEWIDLTRVGLKFLIQQARNGSLTSYTEMNTVLGQRSAARNFDFSAETERAAMGELLGRIVERNRPETGHMISSIVTYLNVNEPGNGFFNLARDLGLLPADAGAERLESFWASEVGAIHAHYRRGARSQLR